MSSADRTAALAMLGSFDLHPTRVDIARLKASVRGVVTSFLTFNMPQSLADDRYWRLVYVTRP